MKDKQKLVAKFLWDKHLVTVEDIDMLLALYGYELHKKRGSHRSYHKKGATPVTVPVPKAAGTSTLFTSAKS